MCPCRIDEINDASRQMSHAELNKNTCSLILLSVGRESVIHLLQFVEGVEVGKAGFIL